MAVSEEFVFNRVKQTAYDGAVTNYRLEQKGLVAGESDFIATRELQLLWQRSNHALRNNGWAAAAKTRHKMNLGAIKVKWKDSNGKVHKKMQALWDEFADNPNKDGYGTLENTQDEWNGGLFDGEIFCRMIIQQRKGYKIPLVIQNISREYLDPLYRGLDKDVNTRNGITFNDGVPVIYNFSKRLTNQLLTPMSDISIEKVQVPADEVLHIFIRDSVNQWRGIPMLAPLLLPLYELDDLSDATVTKQKNAQAISWIIQNTSPTSALAVGSGLTSVDPNDIDEVTGKTRKITQASGGGVQYLNKNETINTVQGIGVGKELIDLMKFELHKIAAGAGLTYEMLTGDLSGVSFSALQQVAIDMKIRAEYIYKLYTINLALRPLCYRFQELAGIYVSSSLTNLKPCYQFPRRYSTNELKDAQADLLELQAKLGTFEQKLEERDLTVEEVAEDLKRQKELGISFEIATLGQQGTNVQSNSNSKG
jgi:lambda family phage portal protein